MIENCLNPTVDAALNNFRIRWYYSNSAHNNIFTKFITVSHIPVEYGQSKSKQTNIHRETIERKPSQ